MGHRAVVGYLDQIWYFHLFILGHELRAVDVVALERVLPLCLIWRIDECELFKAPVGGDRDVHLPRKLLMQDPMFIEQVVRRIAMFAVVLAMLAFMLYGFLLSNGR
jgi:hypothetical protein